MAKGSINMTATFDGLAKLQRLIRGDVLFAKPWSDGMEDLAKKGGGAARSHAPFRSGKLQASIQHAVQKKPFPTWAAVRVSAKTRSSKYPSGYPYPRLLAFSPKHGHKDWLLRAVHPVWTNVAVTLDRIAAGIARNWMRK